MDLINEPVLSLRDLRISLLTPRGVLRAVRGIDLDIACGATLGLAGESGCGKSLYGPESVASASTFGNGRGVQHASRGPGAADAERAAMNALRGERVFMVFQEPMTALNATFTIGQQLTSVYRAHRCASAAEARERAVYLLDKVGISQPAARLKQYPHELSGGMRQRVLIALALMCEPELIVADEPTTALDVTIQKQILDLLRSLQQELGLAVLLGLDRLSAGTVWLAGRPITSLLLINHNQGVIGYVASRLYVLQQGRVVESGQTAAVFDAPQHPIPGVCRSPCWKCLAPDQLVFRLAWPGFHFWE